MAVRKRSQRTRVTPRKASARTGGPAAKRKSAAPKKDRRKSDRRRLKKLAELGLEQNQRRRDRRQLLLHVIRRHLTSSTS